jgi:ferric-dicitrate binding protein FerR (iron transport regulator)
MSRRSLPRIDPAALRDHADEARVERVWERVEHDVAARLERVGPLAYRGRRSTLAYVAIAAALGAFGAGLWVGKVTSDRKGLVAGAPLVTPAMDKSRVEVLAAGTQLRAFPLEGGGRLTLSPGATAEVERTGGEVTVSLLQGEAAIDAGRQRLAVVAGAARINTQAGSVLSVARNADDIDVKVEDGTVSLTSPAGKQELGKGERASAVPIRALVANAPIDAARPDGRRGPSLPARLPASPRGAAVKGPVQPEWLAHYPGDEDGALQLLRKQGVDKAISGARTAAELMAIANIMRGKGRDPAAEIHAWDRLLQGFPKDQRASLAADRLASIYEARGEMGRAQEFRDKVRPLAQNANTGSDSLFCELIRREPDKTKAALMAKEYLNNYPDGECRDDFERLVQAGAADPAPGPAPVPVPAP